MVRIIENYTLYEVIGEGAYGKVYRSVNKNDGKQYAVKVIEVKKFVTNKKLEQCTVHEINILTNIEKNNHIITYYDMLKTQNNFYFVYEYCNSGTLEGMLAKQRNLEEKKALLILRQLLQAFQILNKYNIMHRDLKPDNIFFHNGILKVGDFGFCKSLQKAEMTKTMLGSPIYMAPEILNGHIYSNKSDIWSIGVVLYEMLYGYCPFESNSIPKLIEVLKETQLDFPLDVQVSNETKKLLRRILTKDPQKRIQWIQLFQLNISEDGRLIGQGQGKLSLVDMNTNLSRTVREISEQDDSSPSSLGSSYRSEREQSSTSLPNQTYNSFSSPRNTVDNNRSQRSNQRPQMGFLRRNQNTVEEATTVSTQAPRKGKSQQFTSAREKAIKFHENMVRGMNIARSMGLNQQKNTPIFSYLIFKHISEQMKKFRQQNFSSSNSDLKQISQIFDQEIDEIDYEIAMLRGKVEQFPQWRKAVKAKVLDFRKLRLCYELVMFLCGEASNENISHNDMSYVIRSKIS